METEQSFPKREFRRILGLDMGAKRIGLAVSDPLGITAQGLEVWVRRDRQADLDHLLKVGRDYAVHQIVVGLPRHMDGRLGEAAPESRSLPTPWARPWGQKSFSGMNASPPPRPNGC